MPKIIKNIAIIFIMFAVLSTNTFAFTLNESKTFSDVSSSDWFYTYVEQLVKDGVVDKGNEYRPYDQLNRAELVKMVIQATGGLGGYKASEVSTFDDVDKNAWYYDYVELALKNNIVSGYKDKFGGFTGKFGPADTVTRAAATKILVNAFTVTETLSPGSPFPDVNKTAWYHNFILTAYNQSVLDGYNDGNFGPEDPVTRGQVAKLINTAKNPKVRTSSPTPNPTPDPTPTTEPGDYAKSNWVTYLESGMLTTEYPDEWKSTKTNTINSATKTGFYELQFTDKNKKNIYRVFMLILDSSSPTDLDKVWQLQQTMSNYTKVSDVTIAGKKGIGYTDKNSPDYIYYLFVDGNNRFTLEINTKILTKATATKLRNGFKTPNTPKNITYPEANWLRYTETDGFTTDYPDSWKATRSNNIKEDGTGKYTLNFDGVGLGVYKVIFTMQASGSSKTVDQIWTDLKTSNTKLSDLTIGEKKAISYHRGDNINYYIFVNGNFVYEIQFGTQALNKSIIDKIIKEFELLS